MSARFAQFEHDMSEKLDDIRRRADAAHALAMGAHARFDLLKEGADANRRKTESGRYQKVQHGGLQSPWDVGTESPTGSHVIVPIDQHEASKKNWDDFIDEALKTRELLHDGDTWRWLKENASKIVVAAMASVLAAFLIATVVTSTVAGLPKALPPQPTPSPQHP
jgi:hypothetical protein